MSTSPDLVGDNATNRQAQPENCATMTTSNKRKDYMTIYKVGDHIEEVNLANGKITDTGVVTKIDDHLVWVIFDSNNTRVYRFGKYDKSFRVKAQEQEPEVVAPNPVQELAIIRDIHVGMRDCSKPVVYFTVDLLFGSSLQVIEDIPAFISETGCYKLEDLEGKACVVEKTSNWMIKYVCLKK